MISHVAARDQHWAGMPMPLIDGDLELVVEPSYPAIEKVRAAEDILRKLEPQNQEGNSADDLAWAKEVGFKVRAERWSSKHRMRYTVVEVNGKAKVAWRPGQMRAEMELSTLGAADAWGIEQEMKALELLETLVSARQFRQYMLVGMFLETSKRSGKLYMFRKLRPTVVLDMSGDKVRTLCCLCLHPIAYYAGSWAGAMCPTDDVIAHLMLMRGDEPMFWRRANQHSPHVPEAGL